MLRIFDFRYIIIQETYRGRRDWTSPPTTTTIIVHHCPLLSSFSHASVWGLHIIESTHRGSKTIDGVRDRTERKRKRLQRNHQAPLLFPFPAAAREFYYQLLCIVVENWQPALPGKNGKNYLSIWLRVHPCFSWQERHVRYASFSGRWKPAAIQGMRADLLLLLREPAECGCSLSFFSYALFSNLNFLDDGDFLLPPLLVTLVMRLFATSLTCWTATVSSHKAARCGHVLLSAL